MVIGFEQVEIYMLILARVAGLFFEAPILSSRSFPSFGKICLAMWLAAVLWFVVPVRYLPNNMLAFILALVVELLVGYIIGFISGLVLQSAQAAGDILDIQMGLSVANILSPTTGAQTSITGAFLYLVALLTFFIVNGHHLLISALYHSYTGIPLISFIDFSRPDLLLHLLNLLAFFWLSAIQLCAPILLLIFLVDFSFGIVSRVAPQVNVFMLGFQVKPTIGVFGLMIISPLLITHIINLIGQTTNELAKTITILGGR